MKRLTASIVLTAVLLSLAAVTVVNLTTQVTGVLPFANGGTGKTVPLGLALASTHDTAKTASITTSTACAASANQCNTAGQYEVGFNFTQGGTACSSVTAGSVAFKLTWTDTNGVSHSAISLPVFNSTSNTPAGSFTFTTSNATAYASNVFYVSTNGTVIQYATTYTACTTGTGTYQLDTVTRRLQ